MLKLTVLTVGIIIFVWISWAVKYHFVADRMPLGMKFISFLSIIGIVSFGWLLLTDGQSERCLIASLIIFALSAVVFWRALVATLEQQFGLAFDAKTPERFVSTGLYRYIRHPFYTAYLLFWLGCTIATAHLVSLSILLMLGLLYTITALREENSFAASQFSDAYANYRNKAGLFWPKFSSLK